MNRSKEVSRVLREIVNELNQPDSVDIGSRRYFSTRLAVLADKLDPFPLVKAEVDDIITAEIPDRWKVEVMHPSTGKVYARNLERPELVVSFEVNEILTVEEDNDQEAG